MNLLNIFPAWNASLNALSAVLLLTAYIFIRRKNIVMHKRFMLAACATSLLFLASYVTHHVMRRGVVTKFGGDEPIRSLYLIMLTTHTILAVVILPMAIVSVVYGLRMRVPQHRRVARWTFPIWMYVSVTGVLVYFFLYHWFPSP